MKQVLICIFLLMGFSMNTMASHKETVLIFTCQVGEKPGVPRYSLEISGKSFKVRKSISMLSTKEIEARGSLNIEDLEKLNQVLQKTPSAVKNSDGELKESYSLKARVDGKSIEFTGSPSKHAGALEGFADWVRTFHKNYPGLSAIHPIFPGDEYSPSY